MQVYSQKQSIIEKFLEHGKTMICVNALTEGVSLPKHLMNSIQVKLVLSQKQVIVFENDNLLVELSFNKNKHSCVLPFKSIYYVSKHDTLDGYPFLDDMPEIFLELAMAMEEMEEMDTKESSEISFELAKLELEKKPMKRKIVKKAKTDLV
jgi:stringent starvation protein B